MLSGAEIRERFLHYYETQVLQHTPSAVDTCRH